MDPAVGRFTGVDPLSDRFSHVSSYNYAENEPIGHIDLWGLQKYYKENGAFFKSIGDDESIRILKPSSPFHKYFDFELKANSVPAYPLNDKNEEAVMGTWARKNRESNVEKSMSIFSHQIFHEDGNLAGTVFIVGSTGISHHDDKVDLESSKPPLGIKGWKRQAVVHNHPAPSVNAFSDAQPMGDFGNHYGGDYWWGATRGLDLYLIVEGHNNMLKFDYDTFLGELKEADISTQDLGIYTINKYGRYATRSIRIY